MDSSLKEVENIKHQDKSILTKDKDAQSSELVQSCASPIPKDEAKCLDKEDRLIMPESKKNLGLFAYAPECCRNALLRPYSLLFFLCWASTMQVNNIAS